VALKQITQVLIVNTDDRINLIRALEWGADFTWSDASGTLVLDFKIKENDNDD
jgi:hypothetical protein